MSAERTSSDRRDARASGRVLRRHTGLLAVQDAVLVVAVTLVLMGIAGFVPGLTSRIDAMPVAGHHSGALLFGIFEVSVLLNVLHLVVGFAGLALSRTYARSRAYLVGGGLLFLGLWIYGLFLGSGAADVVPVNNADNWLHFGIGLTMVVLGLTLAASRVPTGADGEVLVPPEL